VNLKKLFERKRQYIRAQLNGQGTFYVVPLNEIQSVVDEAMTTHIEDGDRLEVELVMLRPSEVDALPEFDGF
jgi:hypothetical protein